MLYDTHCHIELAKNKTEKEIIKTFQKNNKEGFLNVIATDIESSIRCINLAKKYSFVYASIGIHPSDLNSYPDIGKTIQELEKIYIENKKYIIGIGECGLDYFHINKNNIEKEKNKQKLFFEAQIKLAKKLNLPLIIHNRDSKDDIFEILKTGNYKNFIFHCWSENLDFANKLLAFAPNCKISFSGIVTFKNTKDIQDVAKNIPLKNILVETDSPYLTPTPLRGKEENEPDFVRYVLNYICELRDENNEVIKKQILENSISTFKI